MTLTCLRAAIQKRTVRTFFREKRAVLAHKQGYNKKVSLRFQKEFLKKKDFEDHDFDELTQKIKTKWNEFVEDHLIEIDNYVQKLNKTW